MYGYIYETTNIINGKKYIGQHKSSEFDESYYGSGKLIQAAIVKYGENNFKVKVLKWCKTRDELNEKEKYYIKLLKESGQEHYNIANGGDGPGSVYDYLNNDDIKKWKHIISIKTKEAMINKGIITENGLSDEMKYKISKATKGHPKSEEMKQKLSNSTKGVPKPWSRRLKSEETKRKMSDTAIRKNQINNIFKNGCTPNKGKRMINKNNTIKYVNESELNIYLHSGWNLGTYKKKDIHGRFV